MLFLLIFVVTFYPHAILQGKDVGSIGERFFKGAILFLLAWRAMRFQLRELWIFPEGKAGLLSSVTLPALFIVGVYFSFDPDTSKYWMFFVSVVTGIYAIKVFRLRSCVKTRGTHFLISEEEYWKKHPEDKPREKKNWVSEIPLWNWFNNAFWLGASFLISGIIALLIRLIDANWVQNWLERRWFLLGTVPTIDVLVFVLLAWALYFFAKNSETHHYEDYAKYIEKALRDDATINPWLVRDAKKRNEIKDKITEDK